MSLSLARPPSVGDPPEFVCALRAGDEAAFEKLVRENSRRLLGVARQVLRNEEDARDALQDAWVAVFRALPRFDGRCRVSTWLYRIVLNAALSRLRARRRLPEQSIEDGVGAAASGEWLEPSHHVLPDVEREEIRALLASAIDRLPESYRSVLLLRDIGDLDTSEAARVLGISANAVKVRLHRARRVLRQNLASYVDSRTCSKVAS